jgi:hypothetical protein
MRDIRILASAEVVEDSRRCLLYVGWLVSTAASEVVGKCCCRFKLTLILAGTLAVICFTITHNPHVTDIMVVIAVLVVVFL